MKAISILFLIVILFVHISTHTLLENNTITTGGSLLSDDGVFTLSVQADGNVVVYGCRNIIATWATGTNNSSAQRVLSMQGDGNLVLYENGVAKWATGTNGKATGPYSLSMQNDGNLVIYASTGAIWASNTNGQGLCELCAYIHDGTNAGTSNQIKLAYYDFSKRYYSECYLNGTKSRGSTYCCTPTTAIIDRTTSFASGYGKYIKIQIYGNDMATIGYMKAFGKQLEYFYDADLNFWGGGGAIVTLTDSSGYGYFSISTGDSLHPVVVTDINQYYKRNGHECYWSYSYDS
jgi:hypothetical protein